MSFEQEGEIPETGGARREGSVRYTPLENGQQSR